MAAKADPSFSFEGYWKGSGTISAKSGNDRGWNAACCGRSAGKSFSFSATRTTEAGRYKLSGHVSVGGRRYTGMVSVGGSKESGRVQLIQRGRSLSVSATGGGGSARVNLSNCSPRLLSFRGRARRDRSSPRPPPKAECPEARPAGPRKPPRDWPRDRWQAECRRCLRQAPSPSSGRA